MRPGVCGIWFVRTRCATDLAVEFSCDLSSSQDVKAATSCSRVMKLCCRAKRPNSKLRSVLLPGIADGSGAGAILLWLVPGKQRDARTKWRTDQKDCFEDLALDGPFNSTTIARTGTQLLVRKAMVIKEVEREAGSWARSGFR